jgi:hypothetical protein
VVNAKDQTYGGDLDITINLKDTSSFAFSLEGSLPIESSVPGFPVIPVPFSIAGVFPLELDLP